MRSSVLFLGAAVVAAATALGAAPASAQFYEQHNLVSSDGDADLIRTVGHRSNEAGRRNADEFAGRVLCPVDVACDVDGRAVNDKTKGGEQP